MGHSLVSRFAFSFASFDSFPILVVSKSIHKGSFCLQEVEVSCASALSCVLSLLSWIVGIPTPFMLLGFSPSCFGLLRLDDEGRTMTSSFLCACALTWLVLTVWYVTDVVYKEIDCAVLVQ